MKIQVTVERDMPGRCLSAAVTHIAHKSLMADEIDNQELFW